MLWIITCFSLLLFLLFLLLFLYVVLGLVVFVVVVVVVWRGVASIGGGVIAIVNDDVVS